MSDTPPTLSPAPEAPQDDGGGHTPLPWRFERHMDHSQYFGNIVGSYGLIPPGIESIRTITVQLRYGSPEEREANAHLIVTAVNAFESNKRLIDDLVAALGKITKAWDEPGRLVDKFHDTELSKAVEKARASLSKAKAKPGEQK